MKKLIIATLMLFIATTYTMAEEFSRVKAKHILVDTRAEAVKIKSDIDEGGSFDYYAQRYSKCPSGKQGGSLGYFGKGQMVKPFEDTAFNSEIGKVSEPVKTQFGWHLIKVEDKIK